MAIFIKKFLFLFLLFVVSFMIIIHHSTASTTNDYKYTLKAYKNTVALYNGEEIINIYDNIVLNTLPNNDIQNFKVGIPILSLEHASDYLKDFDD